MMSYQSVSSYLNFDFDQHWHLCPLPIVIFTFLFALCWLTAAINDFRMGAVGFRSRHFLIYEMYSTYTVDRVYIYTYYIYIYTIHVHAHNIYIIQHAYNIFAHVQM